ncbi:MAG TPA: response regulator [Terriglobales bacterium]|nr:response regulator [Terriglobales bacterium]
MSVTWALPQLPGSFPNAGFLAKSRGPAGQRGRQKVFVVDDESLIADTIAEILNGCGDFEAIALHGAESALELAHTTVPDILITDVVMPGMNGIELARSIHVQYPKTRIVLLSGQAQARDLVKEANHEGQPFELWAKPIHPDLLLERLKQSRS